MSPQLEGVEHYYAVDYRILLNHDEEDQIYEVDNGIVRYRTEHQLSTLAKKIQFQSGKRVLDYGCAKSIMTKRLLEIHSELQYFLYDVSDMYVGYWERLVPESHWAINQTPADWEASFDLVTSYFSLEHIPKPRLAIEHVHSLLREGGTLYGIVPNVFSNPADFVVVDHNNHFTPDSLRYLLVDCGFGDIEIDSDSHRGALVFTARKTMRTAPAVAPADLRARVQELAEFWANLRDNICSLEVTSESPYAIYGSGFYGAYVYSNLEKKDDVKCFLDQSPFQQEKKLFGRRIFAPAALPDDIRTIFVGLNPIIAHSVIEGVPELNKSGLQINFLK
jgi:SAM-dependent methyltransferase